MVPELKRTFLQILENPERFLRKWRRFVFGTCHLMRSQTRFEQHIVYVKWCYLLSCPVRVTKAQGKWWERGESRGRRPRASFSRTLPPRRHPRTPVGSCPGWLSLHLASLATQLPKISIFTSKICLSGRQLWKLQPRVLKFLQEVLKIQKWNCLAQINKVDFFEHNK